MVREGRKGLKILPAVSLISLNRETTALFSPSSAAMAGQHRKSAGVKPKPSHLRLIEPPADSSGQGRPSMISLIATKRSC
jgi:hypothetical protein